jgi:hypothetical protein
MTLLLLALLLLAPLRAAAPAMRVVTPARPAASLLANGGFEALRLDSPAGWQAWQRGFHVAAGEGRRGSRAVVCENHAREGEFGAQQTLALDRAAVAPLVFRGWSKAEDVSGSPDDGYSLYVDLVYADGTPLWGQTADFRCGTHDWEPRELVILPEKPVRRLTVYCLFRGHTGKVSFDDVTVEEMRAEGGAILFEGVPVRVIRQPPRTGKPATLTTRDGLTLTLRDDTVASLRVGGRRLGAPGVPSGFLARDVAAGSDVYAFRGGVCPELGLKVHADYTARADHIAVHGRLSDTTGRDRAVTLIFALPLDAAGWRWGDDIRRSRVIQGRGEYTNTVVVRCGATGTMSLYPLAAIADDWQATVARTGIALALDMGQPAQYRLAYHAGTRQLFIAYDFGLVKESRRFPGSADFRFVIYRFDPRWGFRAAFQKLCDLFPDYFVVRSREQGLWMPFTDVSTVQGWQDFGFRYHEGNNNIPFDDAHGILSFRYTEPMTWWMPMKPEVPRTEAAALRVREEWARGPDGSHRRLAQASRSASMADEDGRPSLLFRREPWCDGAVWSLNPNPYLPGPLNAATVHWNETLKQRLYGASAAGHLDGEYLDSLEGYVTAELNFRREHFRETTVPLTFSRERKQPALFKGLAVYEFTRWIAGEVHRLGKLTFANGVPYRFSFLCPWLDVMGTETDWLSGERYQPASDAQMCLWRTMSGRKPYLLLMNTDFQAFTPALVEKYFQRALFYGIFPGMFSHNAADDPYWQNPRWYNRDRPLFKKYLPVIRRVAEAGWQPISLATCDNPQIFVERFGPDAGAAVYLTLMNESAQPQRGLVTVDAAALRLTGRLTAQELVSDRMLAPAGARFPVVLSPQQTWAVRISNRPSGGTEHGARSTKRG